MLRPIKPVSARTPPRIGDRDARPPHKSPDKNDLDTAQDALLERLTRLQAQLYAEGKRALLIVLQGRDASGKDGTIRRVFDAVNPQGCTVTSFKKPNELERRHDYLWRAHLAVPPHGMLGIWNRSHYEDVLIARVRALVPRATWMKRYRQINDFERMLSENDVTIVKFFLHISQAEQKKQLEERLDEPEKRWKFDPQDLKERALWDAYTRAYRDVLRKCSTPWAPWYIVPSDLRRVRDYHVARVVVETLERMNPQFPRRADVLAYRGKIR